MIAKILVNSLIIVMVLLVFSPVASAQEAEYVMIYGVVNPVKEYHHSWEPHFVFAEEVMRRSGGRIRVELHPGGVLGGIEDQIRQVQRGVIHATDPSEGHLAPIFPDIQVVSIPYLFASEEVAWRVLDGPFGQDLAEHMAATTGVRPLYWSENGGFRHYSNNVRRIQSPEDMRGLKIRTMNIPLHMEIVKALGASPTPVAWLELYTALQTGVVDGQENAIPTFLVPKLEEVQDYIVLDGHVYSVNTVIVNEDWYQGLPEDLQNVIQQAALVGLTVNRGCTRMTEVKGLEYLAEYGVDIYAPTPEEKEAFREATRPVIEWLRNEIGDYWIDYVLEETAKVEEELGYR